MPSRRSSTTRVRFGKARFGLAADAPRQNSLKESFCQYVVRSGDAVIVTDTSEDPRTRENPSILTMGVRAWAGVPLRAPDGSILGSFCVVDVEPHVWSDEDVEALTTLAQAASREIALRASIREQTEGRARAEEFAATLQSTLLPPILPTIAGVDLGARCLPARSGVPLAGDFFDVFPIAEDRWSFVLGDVAGKGIEAAKTAAVARFAIRAAAGEGRGPRAVLDWLNEALFVRTGGDTFVTVVYGTVRRKSDGLKLVVACGGHAPPLVRRIDGVVEAVNVGGSLVGILPRVEGNEATLHLRPGDAFVAYTDGLDEARGGDGFFGHDAIRKLVAEQPLGASAQDLAGRLEHAALTFAGGVAQDDMTSLIIAAPMPMEAARPALD